MKIKFLKTFFLLAIFFMLPNFVWAVYPVAGRRKFLSNLFLLFFLIFSAGFFLVSPAHGAPSINSATPVATFSHDGVVNISGGGFGIKGTGSGSSVGPAIWDDLSAYIGYINDQTIPFSNGCNGESDQAGCTGANLAGWLNGNGHRMGYKTTNPRGKWAASYTNELSPLYGTNGAALGGRAITGGNTSRVIYLTWFMHNSADPSPNGDTSNKFLRLDSQPSYSSGDLQLVLESTHTILYPYGGANADFWDGWTGTWPSWNRIELEVSNPSNSLSFSWWNNNTLQGSHTGYATSLMPYIPNCLGADAANNPMGVVDWNSIYADNTLARVEICNANTKATSNHCEIQIPQTTWNDGQLQIKVNQGSFADDSNQYLYVTDSTGTANASGFPINFGSNGTPDAISPSAPSGLSVL